MNLKPDPILNSMFYFLATIDNKISRAKSLSKSGRHRECRLALASLQKEIQEFTPSTSTNHQTGGLPAGDKD